MPVDEAPRPPEALVFLTVEEAAALLRISPRTLYRLIAARRIPPRRIGRSLRLEQHELLTWLLPPAP